MPPRRAKKIPSVATSAATTPASSTFPSRAPSPTLRQPFRFLDLPSELRVRIYEDALHVKQPVDLDPMNYRLIHPRFALFLVSKRLHEEAYHVFYSQAIRLFPMHGRFHHTKKPLIARLPTRYRAAITTLDLRLGPSWSAPPRCQNTTESLGLRECTNARTLKIFVEIDPSDAVFTGFRGRYATEETYKWFCVDLLRGICAQVPSLETVELDAYPAVKKGGPLIMGLRRQIELAGVRVVWGPLRGWEKDIDEPGEVGLEKAMAGMGLGDMPRLVEVQA